MMRITRTRAVVFATSLIFIVAAACLFAQDSALHVLRSLGVPLPPLGPPGGEEKKIVKQFDEDGDQRLNATERAKAREFMRKENGPHGKPMGPPGFARPKQYPPQPGLAVSPEEVANYRDKTLYDTTILRTLFLDFEAQDWESELVDFHNTDVELPATLTVDGQKYPNVGVHFRGMSSYGMVQNGFKRSLNISLADLDPQQRLGGYKTLNLLNAHEDASFMSTVLYSQIARKYMPAPQANFVKVVINGESWGIYTNVQQFNKEFLAEHYPSTKGTRWKVSGSPMGGGGLEYLGDDIEKYRKRYEMKSNDEKAWPKLIELCRTLNETPLDQLEAALSPLLDLDELLTFLALDNTLINCDGYWIRASDYSIFLDAQGKFHILPHDMNEAFRPPMGPGMGPPGGIMGFFFKGPPAGPPPEPKPPRDAAKPEPESHEHSPHRPPGPPPGPRVQGVELDPLIGLNDPSKPLRSRILAVPSLRERYLKKVRAIAQNDLDWNQLGPIVAAYRQLIEKEVEADTRKLESFSDFQKATADEATAEKTVAEEKKAQPARRPGPPHNDLSLRAFADQRRKYLLNHEAIKKLPE